MRCTDPASIPTETMAFRQKSESRNRGSRRPLQGWTIARVRKTLISSKKTSSHTLASGAARMCHSAHAIHIWAKTPRLHLDGVLYLNEKSENRVYLRRSSHRDREISTRCPVQLHNPHTTGENQIFPPTSPCRANPSSSSRASRPGTLACHCSWPPHSVQSLVRPSWCRWSPCLWILPRSWQSDGRLQHQST